MYNMFGAALRPASSFLCLSSSPAQMLIRPALPKAGRPKPGSGWPGHDCSLWPQWNQWSGCPRLWVTFFYNFLSFFSFCFLKKEKKKFAPAFPPLPGAKVSFSHPYHAVGEEETGEWKAKGIWTTSPLGLFPHFFTSQISYQNLNRPNSSVM